MKWPKQLERFKTAIASAARPCVFLVPKLLGARELDPWASNLCGMPYVPLGASFPRVRKEPLFLVCQINFAEMPALRPFPRKGILQFWITDGTHDASLVVWHPRPRRDRSRLKTKADYMESTGVFGGFDGFHRTKYVQGFRPCSIRFEKGVVPASGFDRDGTAFLDDTFGGDEALFDLYMDHDVSWPKHEHWLGGYTSHGQGDPREGTRNKKLKSYAPLLHLGTDHVGGHNNICWGEAGDASWFFDPRRKKDFSRTFFHWDN